MQFYFIRHAQSENNLLWQRTGSSKGRSDDPGLTAVGRQQAHLLTQHLRGPDPPMAAQGRNPQNVAGFGLTHLYSSLMVRAVATGTIIARVLGLPLVAWEEAHESGGIYRRGEQTDERIGQAGHNRAYFEAHYPDLVLPESLGESGWWNRPFEEPEQRMARAQRFLRQLLERHGRTDDRVAVISHGGFYNYLLAALLKLLDREGIWFVLNNAAITRIDFLDDDPEGAERTALVYMNRAGFLPEELVT
ncbi:MAG: histidine phosphatase family protein [Anaerolineae bacterium]|nr:histidine phosphatase family protein [Anaerolineae bacterium]